MKIELNDPTLAEDLLRSLRSMECAAELIGARTIEVDGWPTRDEASKYELDGVLRVWEATRPGAMARRVD